MTIYGLFGITHGWARVLTLMSATGDNAVRARVAADDGIEVDHGAGRLTQYHERRNGALDRIIEHHDVVVLDNAAWNAKKRELGAAILR
jgi:hypothetical protein